MDDERALKFLLITAWKFICAIAFMCLFTDLFGTYGLNPYLLAFCSFVFGWKIGDVKS